MDPQAVWLTLFCVAALLVALGATSGVVNERLWTSEPLTCMLAGIALGPLAAHLLVLRPAESATDAAILREAARLTLAIAVTGAALRLPRRWLRLNWRPLAIALGPGMLLMWAAGAATIAALSGLPLLPSLLAGAAIAPTDPVLSAPILTGRLAERAVPHELRHAMTAESALNDGLGLPIVMVGLLLLSHPFGEAAELWVTDVLLREILAASLIGIAAGWVTGYMMDWARGRPDAEPSSLLTVTISLALATTAGVRLVGGDEILAAFFAGATLNISHHRAKAERDHERFSEALGRFFDLPIMVLFGAALPWADWLAMGWRAPALAAALLLLRRLPAWMLLGPAMPWTRRRPEAAFAGWFGPVGAAALFYAMMIQQESGSTILWPTISLAIASSVLAHGASGTPFTWIYMRRARGRHSLDDPD